MSRGLGIIVVARSMRADPTSPIRFQMLVLKRLNINSNQDSKASNLTIAQVAYAPYSASVPLFEPGTNETRNALQIGEELGRVPHLIIEHRRDSFRLVESYFEK